jgi:copper chaperone CopZ
MSYYVHDVPGRLRVKIPTLKGNAATAEKIQELLKTLCGIRDITASTVTGSVIVNYDNDTVSSRQILDILKNEGHFDASRAVTNEEYIQSAFTKAGNVVGKALFGLFVEKAFKGTPLSLLTVLI